MRRGWAVRVVWTVWIVLGIVALAGADTPLLGLQFGNQEYENDNWTTIDRCLGNIAGGCDGGATVVDVRAFGALCDGATDDTAALQGAMDACYGGGTRSGVVQLPQGVCLFSQLRVYPGCSLHGVGMGVPPYTGSVLEQVDGVDVSAIVNDPTVLAPDNNSFWHWTEFKDFYLRKILGSTDTLGSGIDADVSTGEGFRIQHVQVLGFPHSGIRLRHGGTTPFIEDVHLHCNGSYGISYETDGRADGHDTVPWHVAMGEMVSGDDNGIALIGVYKGGTGYETIRFTDVKSEAGAAADPRCGAPATVIELDELNARTVEIRNIGATDALSTANDSLVNIKSTSGTDTVGARVLIGNMGSTNITNTIDDDVNTATLARDADDFEVGWYNGTAWWQSRTFNPKMYRLRVGGVADANTPDWALKVNDTTGVLVQDSQTNAANKFGKWGTQHYTNAEEPLAVINGFSGVATGVVSIGGGTSTQNAATLIELFAAATNTTTTGTNVVDVDVNGIRPVPPAAQTIAATDTITADACGGVKRISAAGAVTTNTTNTFTAPAASNAGCVMVVCNTGFNSITLDANANFTTWNSADVVLSDSSNSQECVTVASDGTIWRQVSLPVQDVGLFPPPPITQSIAGGSTITANACGGIKRLTATGPVTTDTTNTLDAPAPRNAGCVMSICNTSANAITLDANANFKTASGANVTLTDADDCVVVGSDGAVWRQLAAVVAGG